MYIIEYICHMCVYYNICVFLRSSIYTILYVLSEHTSVYRCEKRLADPNPQRYALFSSQDATQGMRISNFGARYLKSSGPAVHAWHCLAPLWRFFRAATFAVDVLEGHLSASRRCAVHDFERRDPLPADRGGRSRAQLRPSASQTEVGLKPPQAVGSFVAVSGSAEIYLLGSWTKQGPWWQLLDISFGLSYFEECIHLYIRC